MADTLDIRISGSPEYIKIAKTAVGQLATTAGGGMDAVKDVQTAVAEACRIITCHGRPCWCETLRVICNVDEGVLTATIQEDENGNTLEKDDVHRCLDCPSEGDMGIVLMEHIMDNVEIIRADSGCRKIKITKTLS